MALRARGRPVASLQDEAGVVERRVRPGALAMATRAIRGETGLGVIGVAGALVVGGVAAVAGGRPVREAGAAVAGLAVERLVDALEPVADVDLVAPECGVDLLPGLRRVAVRAARAETERIAVVLAADPMAVFAVLRRALEDQVEVALAAGHGPVLADEREVGAVMRLGRPVLIGARGLRRLVLPRSRPGRKQKQDRDQGRPAGQRHPGSRSGLAHGILTASCR